MVPLLHGLSLLQSAVRANRVSHFQPSTARIISCVRSVLSATDTLVRDAPILNRFPALAQERRGILSVLALLVSQAEKASDETPDEEIQEAQVDAMVQLGGQVFANVRGFLAVAVQCGVELPERRQSVGSIAGSTDTEGHSWINSESFEARTVSYGHEASGSYGLDGFQARTTTPRKVVHANQGSALRARSMVDLRRSSRTSAEDDSDSVVPLLPNDINVPVKTIEEQYLFKERVLRHRAAVRSVNTTSFSLEYTSTPARPSFSVGPSTTASHHPTSTPAQAESSSALLSSSSASVVSVRSARSDKSSSLARKDSLHDDSASTCSGASVSPRGTSFPPSAFIPAAGYQTASSYLSGAPPSLRLNRTSTYGPSSAAARRALPIGARNVTAGGPPAAGANLGLTSVSRRPTPLTLNLRRSNPSLDLSPTRRWASSSGRSTPSSIGIYRPGNRRRESRNSSDGRASAWMSLFTATDSDPGSDDESPLGSPSSPHTSPGEWDFPSYNLSSHQLLLEDLDLTGTVDKLDKYPFESGGVADIHRGTVKSSTLQVAVKIFRRMHSDQETLERTCRVHYTWLSPNDMY
ncbi:hypothetical protein B0H19DRAFT_226431 [Mycena capillaripes]|nr:hypothetical protein B0H19DRAFT_226431 [Mycena capillaripes]